MAWLSGFIRKQGQLILSNDLFALFSTVLLVILPYSSWLAASVVALVTLRKNLKTGGLLLVAAVFTNFMMLNTALSVNGAIIGSLLSYVPCYLAACVLRFSQSWRVVFGALFLLVLLLMCLLHSLHPEFILQQYAYLREMLTQLHFENTFFMLSKGISATEQTIFANYLVGIQAAGVTLSALVSLAFARFIQSKLYYPEGFKQEMRMIRGVRGDLIVLITVLLAAKQHYLIAIDVLPVIVVFFFIAGVSLWFDCMTMQSMFMPILVLSVALGAFPHVMLPVLVLFGSLDVLVNFRLYLRNRANKTIREVK